MGGGRKRRNNFSNSGPTRKSPRGQGQGGRADSNPNWRQSEPSTSESARPRSNAKNSGGGTIEQTQVKIIIETKIIANRTLRYETQLLLPVKETFT